MGRVSVAVNAAAIAISSRHALSNGLIPALISLSSSSRLFRASGAGITSLPQMLWGGLWTNIAGFEKNGQENTTDKKKAVNLSGFTALFRTSLEALEALYKL